MALQEFVCLFSVMSILLCKGCHSQLPACGKAVKKSRIIGGQDASPGSWPWQATIHLQGEYWLGGSLITNQWVLTSASYMSHDFLNDTVVYLGRHSQSGLNPNEVNRTVEDIICHPEYKWTPENDICLLKLSAPVNFTNYIQPICLASENSTFHSGTSSWVIGFGYTSNFSLADILQELKIPIVGVNECTCDYKYFEYYRGPNITENVICAGFRNGGQDSCWWDEGAPLMVTTGSVWVQSGILTLFVTCGLPMYPGIYTRVSNYQKWISDTVTGTPPGFVTFTSPGNDSDLSYICPTPVPTTANTTDNITVCDIAFCSGENLIHFTHCTSFCVLVMLVHVFLRNCGM